MSFAPKAGWCGQIGDRCAIDAHVPERLLFLVLVLLTLRKCRRCVVVIASDGQASDGDVEAALRPLCSLPVRAPYRSLLSRGASRVGADET